MDRDALRDLVLTAISAILLLLIFPPFEFHALAWFALVPLALALDGNGLGRSFFLGWVHGAIFFSGAFYWIWAIDAFNPLDYVLLGTYAFTIYGGGFAAALWFFRVRTALPLTIIAPPLWVAFEYVRAHAFFISAPWFLLGHSQYQNIPLLQLTSLTGVYGLSFLIVLVNTGGAQLLLSLNDTQPHVAVRTFWRTCKPAIVAGCVVAGSYLYGSWIISSPPSAGKSSLALVHTDTSWGEQRDGRLRVANLERRIALTRMAATQSAELIVWPETAVLADLEHDRGLRTQLGQLAIDTRSYLLIGNTEHTKFTQPQLPGRRYNSLTLFSPQGDIVGQYRKVRLVPFGEYTPLKTWFAWPASIVSPADALITGNEFTVFRTGQTAFGAVICWESHFPELFREFAEQGVDFMVNATNENWFAGTAVPDHFLIMTVFRAVENRVSIARTANMGISAIIDPFGRITSQTRGPGPPDGVLSGEVLLSKERTFYTRYGDLFALVQFALCMVMVLMASLHVRVAVHEHVPEQILEG